MKKKDLRVPVPEQPYQPPDGAAADLCFAVAAELDQLRWDQARALIAAAPVPVIREARQIARQIVADEPDDEGMARAAAILFGGQQ